MRERFVITKNVKKFNAALHRIDNKTRGKERIAIVSGEVGLGKTEAAVAYGASNGAIVIRMWQMMTGHWLLTKIVSRLGEEPFWRTEKLAEQIEKNLKERPRTIIFDDIDRFFQDASSKKMDVVETLRDIHDVCHIPIVFIGEDKIEEKIRKFSRLNDRVVERVKFERFNEADVSQIITEVGEYKFSVDAIQKITTDGSGRIRPIMNLIDVAEKAAKINQWKIIEAKNLQW
jgi:DNA transposition AAA+ family ATPase